MKLLDCNMSYGISINGIPHTPCNSFAELCQSMKNAGIISGVGGNNFAPKLNATRAEAAKMIGAVIEMTEVN